MQREGSCEGPLLQEATHPHLYTGWLILVCSIHSLLQLFFYSYSLEPHLITSLLPFHLKTHLAFLLYSKDGGAQNLPSHPGLMGQQLKGFGQKQKVGQKWI